MGMSTVHHWNLHKMMLKKLHTLWATELFYTVHSYVNISITKTTTYAFFLSFLIVLLVRRNERNVGLWSLFHILLISKKPILSVRRPFVFFFPFHASIDHLQHYYKYCTSVRQYTARHIHKAYMYNPVKILQALLNAQDLAWCYLKTIFSLLQDFSGWVHVNESNEECVWISIFICIPMSVYSRAAGVKTHNFPGESVGAHSF